MAITEPEPTESLARSTSEQLRSAVETSRAVSSARTLRRWMQAAFVYALFVTAARRLSETLSCWIDASVVYSSSSATISRLEKTVGRWIGESLGYRWLTDETDPDVIVIDLRDAKTVGPFLRGVDRILAVAIHADTHSTARRVGIAISETVRSAPLRVFGVGVLSLTAAGAANLVHSGSLGRGSAGIALGLVGIGLYAIADTRSWAELRTTGLGRVLVALVVPPEPPDDNRWGESDAESTTGHADSDPEQHPSSGDGTDI